MGDSKSASPQTVLSDMARAKEQEQRNQLKEGGASPSGWTADEPDGTMKAELGEFSLWKDAPVEVFLEILSYSTPHDLLLFSLVNKPLYNMLLSTSPADSEAEAEGKRFWKQARSNVCMPDLRAGGLSERELAGLVGGRRCMVCRDKSEHHMVDYYIRMRLCEDCRETELDHEVDIEDRVGELHPSALACTLFTLDDPRYCDMDDTHYFYKPALREMNDKLVALQLAADKAEGPSTDDPNDPRTVLTRFIRERTELVEKASLDGRDLFQWEKEDHERRYYEEQQRRAQRVRLIKAHLLDLGFDERDCSFEREENEEFLRRSEPLSTLTLQQALPSLIAEISLNSQRRLELESSNRLRERSELLRPLYDEMLASRPTKLEKAVFPHFVLFVALPSVKPFWWWKEETLANAQVEESIDHQSWHTARPSILSETRAIKHSDVLHHLHSLARSAQLSGRVDLSSYPALSLASSSEWVFHPLLSSLLPSPSPLPSIADTDRALSAPFARWLCVAPGCHTSFAYEELRLHQFEQHGGRTTEGLMTSSWVELVVEAMGRAGVASEEGLRGVGEVFECKGEGCTESVGEGEQGTRRMSWVELVKHLVSKHEMWLRGWEQPEAVIKVLSARKGVEENAEEGAEA